MVVEIGWAAGRLQSKLLCDDSMVSARVPAGALRRSFLLNCNSSDNWTKLPGSS